MSKKMLKRSLALGALMAFVITGSAWAAEVVPAPTNPGGNAVKDTVVVLDLTENSTLQGGYTVPNPTAKVIDTYIFNLNDKTLVVNGNISVGATNVFDFNGSENSILTINGTLKSNGTVDVGELKVIGGSLNTYGTDMTINTKNTTIDATGTSKYGINVQGDSGTKASKLEINTGSLTVKSDRRALRVAYGNTLQIKADKINITGMEDSGASHNGSLILTANEGVVNSDFFAGEIDDGVVEKGNINFTLGKDVEWTGKVTTEATGTGDDASVSNITLNGATWNVTGDSNVSEIGGNDANIKVKDAVEAAGWVKVGEVSAKKLTVATETDDSDTQETLDALAKVAVLADDVDKSAATQVQLKNAIYDNVVADVTDNGIKIAEKEVAAANISVNDMAAIGLMSWRAEMNDMNKRMGELRNANGEHGVWVRMVRGESEYNSVKNQYNQYQLGYDEKLSTDPSWTVGVALSYTDAENNFAEGYGESTNKALSIYGSKLNEDGTFIDLIAKYARLENDFTTYSGQGAGEYDANGYSFSAEFGKRIQQGKGLWIEPQVELTYGKVGSADYVTEKGVNVAQDSMDSIVGRIGFSLGKDIKDGNVYARASYLYDFDGETKATLNNDAVLEQDLGGGWWEVGVGANINLSKATYIYADVEKTFGGEVDTNWQWNLGVRYSF